MEECGFGLAATAMRLRAENRYDGTHLVRTG
jgi:hypothetical protein